MINEKGYIKSDITLYNIIVVFVSGGAYKCRFDLI